MSETVYIALGGNLGDRLATLRAAVARLGRAVRLTAVSPVYETAPVGFRDQKPFLNAVVAGETALDAPALLAALQGIERELGRERPFPNAPRTIDLDLLFYGTQEVDTPDLIVPHPRLHERHFVLVPLADLAPDLRHPRLGRTIGELRDDLGPAAGIERVADDLAW